MKLSIWMTQDGAGGDDFDKKLGALRMATGRADRFVQRCACAVHDRLFTVVYERTDPARPFAIVGIYKDGTDGGAGGAQGAARPRALAASEVDTAGWRCPYCRRDRLLIQCAACGSTVCGGRVRLYPGSAEIFECRDSCGARGAFGAVDTVSGIDGASSARSATGKPVQDVLPAPGAQKLQIDGPKTPRLK